MSSTSKLYFNESHEWISAEEGGQSTLGISDFAQSELGDIVYITLPEAGKTYSRGEKIGEIESVKSVSEIYAPVSMKVLTVNSSLNENPELINSDPYGSGFIAKVEPANPAEINELMDQESYGSFVASEGHD